MRRALPLTLLLAAAACSGTQDGTLPPMAPCPTAEPTAEPSARAPEDAVPPPAAITAAEGVARVVADRADIALTGPRVDGKPGDVVLDNGTSVVVVTSEGRIADFGLKGARDELVWLNPTLSIGLGSLDAPVARLAPGAGGKAIVLERAVAGKPLWLVTWLWLTGSTLHAETTAKSTGDDPALAVTLGERVSWGNFPTWMDGHGLVKDSGKLTGGFLGRDALGVAYALCSQNGPLFARFDDQEYSGFFEPARTGESVVLVPARGQSTSRSIAVTVSGTSLAAAVSALPCGPEGPRTSLALAAVPVPRARVEIARCDDSGKKAGKPYVLHRGAPGAGDAAGTVTFTSVELPQGCFRARLTAPGHTPGPWVEPEKLTGTVAPSVLPVAGTLAFSVTEKGSPSPARLVVRGENVPDPDWGDDADSTGAASNVLATEKGTGEAPLPPGKYRVMVNHGFEHTAHEQAIEIKAGKTTTLKASLDHVVDTKGWISADLHLHAVPSPDAPSLLTDRIRSLLAAGVEVAVATDHNAVTDYTPAIAELGVTGKIASLVGDEITTRDTPFGHFNAFPLDPKTPPFKYKGTTPAEIFSAVRSAKPFDKDTIVQVNHPRMGNIGYFEILRFDADDIPAWLRRSPLADMGFDALEVFNGDHYNRISKVEEVMADWFALLNAGYRTTATGNSDSHRVSFHDAGVPHNLVRLADDDPAKLDPRAFIDAVRAGRVVVTSGPFVTMKIGEAGIGDSIAPGKVEIAITADGPPWVDIDEVTLVKRGQVLKTWRLDKKAGKRPLSFKHEVTLAKDDWVIAIARGKKPMTYLYRAGATPFAFTNPIFVK
ncbi:MAG: CehA/McbA family metallohydrolase [Polyangiaceae bacterium]